MDVLVQWKDGRKNVVSSLEIECVKPGEKLKKGTVIKMLFKTKWYEGVVLDTEEDLCKSSDSSSSDNVPLSKRFKKPQENPDSDTDGENLQSLKERLNVKTENAKKTNDFDDNKSDIYTIDSPVDDTDSDPTFTAPCEVLDCVKDMFKPCTHCHKLLCYYHFAENAETCDGHGKDENKPKSDKSKHRKHLLLNDRQLQDLHQTCEVNSCKEDVFSSCHMCNILLCYGHFMEDIDECQQHGKSFGKDGSTNKIMQDSHNLTPESFTVEGSSRELLTKENKERYKNREAKLKRNKGLEYVSPKTKKIVPARELKEACESDFCSKGGRMCGSIDDKPREEILKAFYDLGDLKAQREFILRHVDKVDIKQRTTGKMSSRRTQTLSYSLTVNDNKVKVCKKFFMNTLCISERTIRTAFQKLNQSGVLEKEKRGGRTKKMLKKDKKINTSVENHISRFPRMESHYCRASTTKEYLHPDLNVRKMYNMFRLELKEGDIVPSFSTYLKVFKKLNLSFHHPKKDMCTLCQTYRDGDENTKAELKEKYELHISEKNKVREIKEKCKEAAKKSDSKIFCGTFDLQQVFHLPITNESAVFYKRRYAVYNLTVYDIGTKDCTCYLWHEVDSKRGSSEIATCVFLSLKDKDKEGCKRVDLFCDGCGGQNKNSIIASMILYAVANSNCVQEISLKYFESYHGQSEGDAAHSTISTALKNAGNIYVPSQLVPVLKLARKKHPYKVVELQHDDFQDFKALSKELRILKVRESEGSNKADVNWRSIKELRVLKSSLNTIFYKDSHLETQYKKIQLKRLKKNITDLTLQQLNDTKQKISEEKYSDLVSLCTGVTPVVRMAEHQHFYKNLNQ